MKEFPIIFNSEMVMALLDGRKTQARRMVKPQPTWYDNNAPGITSGCMGLQYKGERYSIGYPPDYKYTHFCKDHCPYGQPGDRLWVRETWAELYDNPNQSGNWNTHPVYKADYNTIKEFCDVKRWKPSIHMPRWASRITLEITDVRVERVQDIRNEDILKEGTPVVSNNQNPYEAAQEDFAHLWNSIYKNWDDNPWVWAIEFRRVNKA